MNTERHGNEAGTMRKKRKYLIRAVPVAPVVDSAAEPGPTPAVETVAGQGPTPAELERTAVARFSKSRHELIAEVAYYKAERRGFEGGDPDRDWHEAEMEVEELLRKGRPF